MSESEGDLFQHALVPAWLSPAPLLFFVFPFPFSDSRIKAATR